MVLPPWRSWLYLVLLSLLYPVLAHAPVLALDISRTEARAAYALPRGPCEQFGAHPVILPMVWNVTQYWEQHKDEPQEYYTPRSIQDPRYHYPTMAALCRDIKSDVDAHLGESVEQAVVSVPFSASSVPIGDLTAVAYHLDDLIPVRVAATAAGMRGPRRLLPDIAAGLAFCRRLRVEEEMLIGIVVADEVVHASVLEYEDEIFDWVDNGAGGSAGPLPALPSQLIAMPGGSATYAAQVDQWITRGLCDAAIDPGQLAHVLLVGPGASDPTVRRVVAARFGKITELPFPPEEAVVRGLVAIAARMQEDDEGPVLGRDCPCGGDVGSAESVRDEL